MSSQYKENNFSTESSSSTPTKILNNMHTTTKPNIDHLIKRIHVERRREAKRNIVSLGVVVFSLILIFYFFQG